MIVMKFGGTSVQDADAIRNAASIVVRETNQGPLVVTSACAGVTNALIRMATAASQRASADAVAELDTLRERHLQIAVSLLDGDSLDCVRDELARYCDEIAQLIHCVSILQELTPRTLDQFAAYGELCSSLLLTHELRRLGVAAALVDARKVLVTDDEFGKATPLFKLTKRNARVHMWPMLRKGQVVVTQGFIGSTRSGVTSTLGRGGSDYSAAIFGSVLDAEEIQIWTDVEGILTADPSVIAEARSIPEMTFQEAAELAYFGARVLHPSTIAPAVHKNIPVRVLNSQKPDSSGTLIRQTAAPADSVVKSVAYKEGITVVRVQSTDMLLASGFLPRLFEVFARHNKCIDIIATSLVGLSLTVQEDGALEAIVAECSEFAEVAVERNKAICCVVGEKVKYTHGIAARVFSALDSAGINVEMISLGGSDINLTFVINQEDVESAINALHNEFFAEMEKETPLTVCGTL
jgi:aspartate kinase